MRGGRSALRAALLWAMAAAWLAPGTSRAAELFDHGGKRLVVSGYLQQATGLNHLTYDTGGLLPEDSAFHGGTLRVRWGLQLGESVRVDVHNRLLWSVSAPAQAGGTGSLIGVGASAAPKRWLDLDQQLAKADGLFVQHDLDRLKLSVQTPVADLKIGRQAITWGFTSVIPVADVWVQQSPFELDRVEKRGLDAVRALLYPHDDVEVDVVVADRGSWADLSGGVRAAYGGAKVEAYVAVAKLWRDLWAAGGVTWLHDVWKVRLEAAAPWSLDDVAAGTPDGLDAARATLGVDRIGTELTLGLEVHWNGPGAAAPGGYIAAFAAPAMQRGTAYVVGRLYGAAMASWQLADRWTLAGTAMANLRDPSALLAGTLQWEVGPSANLIAAVYGGLGDAPDLSNPFAPALGSEYGTYGVVSLIQAVLHF